MKKKSVFKDIIQFESKPELKFPVLFASWPGMGNVALNASRYLVEKLDMEPLGRIDSSEFASADGILIRNNIVLPVDLPEYRFFFWRHPKGIGDLIVFIADNQPAHPKGYALARTIVRVANLFGTRRIYTVAAMACSISHMDAPQVWAAATHPEILEELKRFPLKLLSEGHISGLNGLILGVAKQMGFEGACLLGELPYYTIGMDNPKSSLAVLEQLSSLWEIHVDLTDLRDESIRKEIEIEGFIRTGKQKIVMEEMISERDKDTGSPQ